MAALPQRWHWDVSAFHLEEVEYSEGIESDNFTEALWKAIAMTRSTEWARIGDIAPKGVGWTHWLEKAEEMAVSDPGEKRDDRGNLCLPAWDYESALSDFLHPDAAVRHV